MSIFLENEATKLPGKPPLKPAVNKPPLKPAVNKPPLKPAVNKPPVRTVGNRHFSYSDIATELRYFGWYFALPSSMDTPSIWDIYGAVNNFFRKLVLKVDSLFFLFWVLSPCSCNMLVGFVPLRIFGAQMIIRPSSFCNLRLRIHGLLDFDQEDQYLNIQCSILKVEEKGEDIRENIPNAGEPVTRVNQQLIDDGQAGDG
ncbi:hypothetical protein MA16_Dca006220 [Dendrobium catenatum]|uniref:Uncharacterized protein n=1 Tax=Dendrobium catenatum TaxID=906689 RepID=A0A2I0X4U2_9ASPA|nr:hypothetical protein MA16_Dca006220 [Dendrobium catenatum]